MTSDPIEIIRGALEDSADQDDEGSMWLTEADFTGAADRIARALADAGLLTPTNATTRTEWGAWYPTDTDTPRWQYGHAPDSGRAAFAHTADGYGERHGVYVVSRTVHEGPWQPASPPTDTTQET